MFIRIVAVLSLFLGLIGTTLAADLSPKEPHGLPFDNGFEFNIPMEGLQLGTAPADLAKISSNRLIQEQIKVDGDRFVLAKSGKAIRFWGTNLCYSACFLPEDVADRLVKRFVSLGINIVRFHHMDQRRYPGGIWDRDAKIADGPAYRDITAKYNFRHERFDPEAMQRLDYLIAKLKQNGIRVNLNLKVSREFGSADGFTPAGKDELMPRRGRGLDFIYGPIIEAQKKYARMLLHHTNAYTGLRYADDPVISMVEINNENGLIYGWNIGMLERLPKPYHDDLVQQWNDWLKNRYANTKVLSKAWGGEHSNVGPSNLLQQPRVERGLSLAGGKATTRQNQSAGDIESADENKDVTRIVVQKSGASAWRVRYRWMNITLKNSTDYMLRLTVKANQQRSLKIQFRQNQNSRKTIRSAKRIRVTTHWKTFKIPFHTPDDLDSNAAQILMDLGYEGLVVDLGAVSIQSSNPPGLVMGEGIDQKQFVPWLRKAELAGRSQKFQMDAMSFLRDSEIRYWQNMKHFLQQELGVKAPISGTTTGHTTPQIAATTFDFIDTHRYWGSPKFERGRYDRNKWFMDHQAMINHPNTSSIAKMAARRIIDMPFTITEYNHPQPQDYQAEGFPMLAVYGSQQNWQGIFQFAYSHNNQTIETHGLGGSFFDLAGNPMQLAMMPACSAIFRNQAVPAAQNQMGGFVPVQTQLAKQMVRGYPRLVEAVAYEGGVPENAWTNATIGLVRDADQTQLNVSPSQNQPVQWSGYDKQKGSIQFKGSTAAGLIGFVQNQTLDLGWLKLTSGPTSLDGFAVILLNAVDGQPLGEPGRYLITATTRCANRNMGWNQTHTSLGTDWGNGPTLNEPVPMQLAFSKQASNIKIYPLNSTGMRQKPLRINKQKVNINTTTKTVWYELQF